MNHQLRRQLPDLHDTYPQENPIVWVRYFTPDSHWYFYGIEFDGQDTFLAAIFGRGERQGYLRLSLLEAWRGPLGLPVERDPRFQPVKLSQVREYHHQRINFRW